MKKQNTFLAIGILLLSTVILFSACKKKADDPVPVSAPTFVVTSQPNGTDYFNIWAKCITDDILLTKVIIKDPFNISYTYTGNQQLWLKDEIVGFPDTYPKSSGTWLLTFYGNRSSDNSSFVSNASVTISGKK
ncbi:MAG TPA: hypothetical protein VFE66_07960 [Bacteroidales bacterium]|nr:hypothetical protein [Bacteroidales bacterium]